MAYAKPIQLLDFQPDADARTPGVILDMDGLIATAKGLKAQQVFSAFSQLPAPTRGIVNAELTNGYTLVIAGTATSLFRVQQAGPSLMGDGYNAGPRWRFAVFGNDVLAANGVDELQISHNAALFIPVSAMPRYTSSSIGVISPPPNPAIVEASDYGVFLIPPASNRWFFCPNDVTWELDIATLTVSATLDSTPGPITAFHALRSGLVVAYKAHAIHVGNFTGPPFAWAFPSTSEQVGCMNHECVINAGDYHLFIGQDNFYRFDGQTLTPIPNNLREWFFAHADRSRLHTVLGRFDDANALAVWHFSSTDAPTEGDLDLWVAYHIPTGKWTKGSARVLAGDDGIADIALESGLVSADITYDAMETKWLEDAGGYGDLSGYPEPGFPVGAEPAPTYTDMFDEEFAEDEDADLDADATSSAVAAIVTSTGMFSTQVGPAAMSFLLSGEIGDGIAFWQLSRVRPIFGAWPADGWGHLQSYKRAVNGYPIPDPVGHQDGEGPQAWLARSGDFNLVVTARAHQLRADFAAAVEIVAVAIDLAFAGTE